MRQSAIAFCAVPACCDDGSSSRKRSQAASASLAAVELGEQQRQVEVRVGIVGLRLHGAAVLGDGEIGLLLVLGRQGEVVPGLGEGRVARHRDLPGDLGLGRAALRLEHVAEIEGQHGIGGVGAHRRGVEALGRGVVARGLGLLGLGQKIVDAARLLLVASAGAW